MKKTRINAASSRTLLLTISFGGLVIGAADAQTFPEVVASDDFEAYTDNSFVVASNGTTTLVPDGDGGNAIQYSTTTGGGGFFASGFDWVPINQPGPDGPNISTALTDYQVSFDLTINSEYKPGAAIEIWLKDESSTSANLYSVNVAGFVTGVPQTVSFTIEAPVTTNPFGYPGNAFTPTLNELRVRFNGLDFGSPANTTLTFTVDNFSFNTIIAGDEDSIESGGPDGLPDIWELLYYNPIELYNGMDDPDEDDFDNLAEYQAGSNPIDADSIPGDIDGDGMADADEDQFFGNNNGIIEPGDLLQGPDDDFDDDFVSNAEEIAGGTLPNNATSWPDVEPDGMNDGWERAYGLNVGVDDSDVHDDSDDFTNLEEHNAGTDPTDGTWSPVNALLRHRWSFNGDLTDAVGGSDAQIIDPDFDPATGGVATQNPTSVSLGGGAKAQSDYILLGGSLLSGLHANGPVPVTIELWVTPEGLQNWSRIFAFGVDNGSPGPNQSLRMTWTRGTVYDQDQVEWQGRGASFDSNAPYQLNKPHHIVMTIVPAAFTGGALTNGARITWYSSPAASSQSAGHPLLGAKGTFNVANSNLDDLVDTVCYLGRSMYNDSTAQATYDEMRIWVGALTETERELFQLLGPDDIDRIDSEPDGFPDAWEMIRFGNTTSVTGAPDEDFDQDGESDALEFANESDPNNPDSISTDIDGDGFDDATELLTYNNLLRTNTGYDAWALANLLVPNVNDGASDNPDNDAFSNQLEYQLGGDPRFFETDLVTVSDDEGTLTFTFERLAESLLDSSLNFRWSTDLDVWNVVPIGETSAIADEDGVVVTVMPDAGPIPGYDTIEVVLPAANADQGRIFGQLEGESHP